MSHASQPALAFARPTLRYSSSVPSFVDPDRIMYEEEEEAPMTPQHFIPSIVHAFDRHEQATTPHHHHGASTAPTSYGHSFNGTESACQTSAQPAISHVQHNAYTAHFPPYAHGQQLDCHTRAAETSPFSFEHPFLVRPRYVRGKHPMVPPTSVAAVEATATPTPKSAYSVHNPYSFNVTVFTPEDEEFSDSPNSSMPPSPTSPISSRDSAQFTMQDSTSHDTLHTSSSFRSNTTASSSSEWSANDAPMPIQKAASVPTTTYSVAPPAPYHGGQYYCPPQGYSMSPPQICGPYGSPQQHHYGPPTCCVTTPVQQPYAYGYDYSYTAAAVVYNNSHQQNSQQQQQYLCVPPGASADRRGSHCRSDSENGLSDDGQSVLSSLQNSSPSVSAIEEASTASLMGAEGAKKKRYRARCPTCSTTPDVKRLRFKRGFTYFVCLRCHFKWRLQGAK